MSSSSSYHSTTTAGASGGVKEGDGLSYPRPATAVAEGMSSSKGGSNAGGVWRRGFGDDLVANSEETSEDEEDDDEYEEEERVLDLMARSNRVATMVGSAGIAKKKGDDLLTVRACQERVCGKGGEGGGRGLTPLLSSYIPSSC